MKRQLHTLDCCFYLETTKGRPHRSFDSLLREAETNFQCVAQSPIQYMYVTFMMGRNWKRCSRPDVVARSTFVSKSKSRPHLSQTFRMESRGTNNARGRHLGLHY